MKYGLIGRTLGHSFSKEIHSYIGDYGYDLCEIEPQDLGAFFEKADFKGVNVTIPYKEKVIPFLDRVSDEAKKRSMCAISSASTKKFWTGASSPK